MGKTDSPALVVLTMYWRGGGGRSYIFSFALQAWPSCYLGLLSSTVAPSCYVSNLFYSWHHILCPLFNKHFCIASYELDIILTT